MKENSQELFKKIRKIQMRTTQLADDLLAGAWHSVFKGRGMEFEEVRQYQTGDEIRSIDWNVTARMNNLFVKVFQEERELSVMLIVDVSSSSRFGSQNALKKDLIAEIGAVLAFSAIKNNDKVGLILFSEKVEKHIPPKKGAKHVLRVIRELLAFEPSGIKTDLKNALSFAGGMLKKSAICFLISDFICPLPKHQMILFSKKHDFISILVSDPYELNFPKMEMLEITDLETRKSRIVDTSNAQLLEEFHDKSSKRVQVLDSLMKTIGAGFIQIRTDTPYLAAMRRFFKLREIKH